MIIYVHLPKSGGKTLQAFFNKNIPGENLNITKSGIIHQPYTQNEQSVILRNKFISDPLFFKNVGSVSGHFTPPFQRKCSEINGLDIIQVTITNCPFVRAKSFYKYYLKYSHEHPVGEFLKNKKVTFEDFVAMEAEEIRKLNLAVIFEEDMILALENGQSKQLAGIEGLPTDVNHLINIVEDRFALVGTTQRIEEFFCELAKIQKIRFNPLFRNKNSTSEIKIDVTPQAYKIIYERNNFDIILNSYFENKLANQKASLTARVVREILRP